MNEVLDMRQLFRTDTVRGIKEGKTGVDRENGIIHGFAVISKGDARGHNQEIDDITLQQAVELGNKAKVGLKSRFGHPNMSSEALGTYLGRATNFRREGDVIRADLYFDKTAFKTPDGDLASYVMDLAESDPTAFGSSIVFEGKPEYRFEKDGTPKKDPSTGEILKPLARIKKLWAVDVVDDPAANSGMFSFMTESVKPSAEMTAFLNKFLENPNAVEKALAFLERYSLSREYFENNSKTNREVKKMEVKEITLEMLKAERADLIEALKAESDPLAFQKGKDEGVKLERARALGIVKKAKAFTGMEDASLQAVESGESLETAESRFKDARIKQLESNSPPPAGPSNESSTTDLDALPLEEKANKQWQKDPKLRAEFGSLNTYISYLKAEQKGLVRISKK